VISSISVACQRVTGPGGNNPPSVNNVTTNAINPSNSVNSDAPVPEHEFPLTPDAFNVVSAGDSTVIYYSYLSIEDILGFYRDKYEAKGYAEREILTVVSGTVATIVFDGDPSGHVIVIQTVDLGDGNRSVTVRFEDV